MGRYNIYGIGAALVDTEIEVSERFLADKNIEKGIMTLVDEIRQRELLKAISADKLQVVKKCGGSICNSMVAASNLGAKTFFTGKVADDEDGDLYITDLNRAGVEFHSAGQAPGTTGKCLVMVTQDAERTLLTFLGASESLSPREIDKQCLKNSDWLFIEGYLFTDDKRTKVVQQVIEFAKKNGVRIAISLSDSSVVEVYGDVLRDVINGGVDLIFCNKDEALALTGSNRLDWAIEDFKCFTRSFVITDGGNGAITFDGESLVKSTGTYVRALDTNGAGDMFAGAFLFAITSGKSFDWAASLANYCASRVVMKFGPRLECDDYLQIKAKFDI